MALPRGDLEHDGPSKYEESQQRNWGFRFNSKEKRKEEWGVVSVCRELNPALRVQLLKDAPA